MKAGDFYAFQIDVKKADDALAALDLAKQAVEYARELEMIVWNLKCHLSHSVISFINSYGHIQLFSVIFFTEMDDFFHFQSHLVISINSHLHLFQL